MAKGFKQREKSEAIKDVRVAAYIWVDKEVEKEAVSVEMETRFVEKEPGVIYREVQTATYIDDSEAGTFILEKPAFQKMIQDALDGKIDKIVTFDICSFTGNAAAALYYCKLLKEKGIAVAFLDMGICSFCECFEDTVKDMPCFCDAGLEVEPCGSCS